MSARGGDGTRWEQGAQRVRVVVREEEALGRGRAEEPAQGEDWSDRPQTFPRAA